LIPKNPPPILEGQFSKPFREFVSYCLQRDPRERPSARELLKHKFVRMAKKTSYLTELIERHERWKAEGGERLDEDERDNAPDLPAGADPEDLWDFGTVRNGARGGTIGRAQQNPIQVSGPPLTWENSTSRSKGSGSSGSSIKSSLSKKTDLPPLPPSEPPTPSRYSDQQATVRNVPSGSADPNTPKRPVQREPSDDYEDYGDQYQDTFPSRNAILEEGRGEIPLDDELPDTTMLDSVILPAIASLFPRVSTQEARVALSALQRAFTDAERIIPGVTMEFVNEIVDSVEHVEEDER